MSERKSMCEFTPGDAVTWSYECRGGWGYVFQVPAFVVKVTAKRVGIGALYTDGETWVPRWVKPESLRPGRTWAWVK